MKNERETDLFLVELLFSCSVLGRLLVNLKINLQMKQQCYKNLPSHQVQENRDEQWKRRTKSEEQAKKKNEWMLSQ